jgi:hypothetical protein
MHDTRVSNLRTIRRSTPMYKRCISNRRQNVIFPKLFNTLM